ncbi:MAG: MFS transporter, partial [Flavobacteriia bacterium]|nr:MFS transporter [Flavobacteriia bacterium]
MFRQTQIDGIKRGDLRLIFKNRLNFRKYLQCIAVGIPIWFIVGLLIMNSKDDFGPMLGLKNVNNGYAVMYAYIGLSIGDLIAGLLSQWLKSRKKVVVIFLLMSLIVTLLFLFGQ